MDSVNTSFGWLQANLINILYVILIAVVAFWVAGLVKNSSSNWAPPMTRWMTRCSSSSARWPAMPS